LLLATCSIFREENRDQVDDFVGRHAGANLVPLPGQDGLDVQLLPDESHDGFYYALLERASSAHAGSSSC
jgi:16S rRNA (cytosine967-C5)-methyltransferase